MGLLGIGNNKKKNDADRDTGIETKFEEYDSMRAAEKGINEMARQGWTASAPQPITMTRKGAAYQAWHFRPGIKPRLLVTFTRARR